MNPKLTPQTWPENVQPTMVQLRDWLTEQSPEGQVYVLGAMWDNGTAGQRCFMEAHRIRIEQQDWTSARRWWVSA